MTGICFLTFCKLLSQISKEKVNAVKNAYFTSLLIKGNVFFARKKKSIKMKGIDFFIGRIDELIFYQIFHLWDCVQCAIITHNQSTSSDLLSASSSLSLNHVFTCTDFHCYVLYSFHKTTCKFGVKKQRYRKVSLS